MSAIFLFHGLVIGAWATQVPLLRVRLGLAPAALGLALFCAAAGALATMPVTGRAAMRVGPGPVLRVGSAAACAAFFAAVLAPGFVTLCLALLVFGMGYGAVDVAMNTEAVRVERALGRPILGGVHAMWSVGSFAGSAAGAALLTVVAPAVQAGLLGSVAAVSMQLATGRLDAGARSAASGEAAPAARPWRDRRLLLIGVVLCFSFMVEGSVADWSGVYLRSARHVPAAAAALGYSAFSACMVAMRFAGDRVRRAIGDGGVLAGAFVAAAGLALVPLMPSDALAIAGFGVAGVGVANVVPALFALAGTRGAGAVGVATTLGYAGVLAGPPLFGAVAQATSLEGALGVSAGFCCLIGCAAGLAARGSVAGRPPGS